MDTLLAYINSLPRDEQKAFGKACGTSIGYLRKAISKGQEIGEKICISIERESGGAVRCETLRPDVDWAFIRGTDCPEPAGKPTKNRRTGRDRRSA